MRFFDPAKNPFFEHAEVAHFVATRDGRDVGRVAAIRNRLHEETHGDATGFFGFLAVEDDAGTVAALLDAAGGWLAKRGLTAMRGPVSYDMNNEVGVLVDGFDEPPAVLMPWNPSWLPRRLEAAGLAGVMDLYAHHIPTVTATERIVRLSDRLRRREGIAIRTIRMDRFGEEVELVRDLYNAAWEANFGYVPMTDAEIAFMARDLRPIVDPRLILFAEVQGRPVGFAMALPNVNEVLRKVRSGRLLPCGFVRILFGIRKIRRLRVITLGTLPEYRNRGVELLFYRACFDGAAAGGYADAECSWILADNDAMNRGIREACGGRIWKTYRLYERPLGGPFI